VSLPEVNQAVDLNGTIIPLTVPPIATAEDIEASSDRTGSALLKRGKGTASALLCFPVPQPPSRDCPQGTERITIALRMTGDSFTSLDMHPVDGINDFYLTIGWVDAVRQTHRNIPPQHAHHGASQRREPVRPVHYRPDAVPAQKTSENASIHSSMKLPSYHPHPHPQHAPRSPPRHLGTPIHQYHSLEQHGRSTNMGLQSRVDSITQKGYDGLTIITGRGEPRRPGRLQSQGSPPSPFAVERHTMPPYPPPQSQNQLGKPYHPGDWICCKCFALVFSFRSTCYNCHASQPDAEHCIVPRQPPKTAERPDGDLREGDWLCPGCQGHNFSSKIACFTCRMPRTPSALSSLAAGAPEKEKDGSPTTALVTASRVPLIMPGDWTCPTCKENVFAKRHRCYKCSTSKPR
jgi:hypothetical protein